MKIRSVGFRRKPSNTEGKCNQAKMLACRKRVIATLKKLEVEGDKLYYSGKTGSSHKVGLGMRLAVDDIKSAMRGRYL